MGDFKKNIDLFLAEAIQDSIRKLRNIDEEHDYIRKNHAEASKKYEKILETLSDEDREFLEKFKDEMYEIEGRIEEWLYLQGYKDCIKLLKMIEAI